MKVRWILAFFVLLMLATGTTHAASSLTAEFFIPEDGVHPTNVEPGKTYTMNITLQNLAPAIAAYLKASLDPLDTSPVDPIGVSRKYLSKAEGAKQSGDYFGTILQKDKVTLSFPIYVKQSATEDVYNVPLLLEWKDGDVTDRSQTINIAVLVKGDIKLGIASVETDPKELRAGDDSSKISVTFTNSGKADAKNLKVTMDLMEPFTQAFSEGNQVYIGSLNAGEEKAGSFYMDLSETAEPGKYELPLIITYEDQIGSKHEMEDSVDIAVKPKPYFKVTKFYTQPSTVGSGDNVKLFVEVENIGGEMGESVDLKVIREVGQPFSFDTKSNYIGNLRPGEKGTGVLEFTVDSDAVTKDYLLKLSVRSVGDSELGDTNVYTQELQASVKIGESSISGNNLPFMAIGLILVLALGFVLGRKL